MTRHIINQTYKYNCLYMWYKVCVPRATAGCLSECMSLIDTVTHSSRTHTSPPVCTLGLPAGYSTYKTDLTRAVLTQKSVCLWLSKGKSWGSNQGCINVQNVCVFACGGLSTLALDTCQNCHSNQTINFTSNSFSMMLGCCWWLQNK